jgi:NAD(P)-dependent dehydrogenase (short-subunit alcohol dehydrogenase family)
MTPGPLPPQPFPKDKTYLVVGGLGRVGREICRWMTRLGARNIVILSRSGLGGIQSTALMDGFRELGVEISVQACDVGNESELKESLKRCQENMPLLRGVVHCGMQLKVSIPPYFHRSRYGSKPLTLLGLDDVQYEARGL